MLTTGSHKPRVRLNGLCITIYSICALLLVLSLIYWKERATFSDGSGYIVNFANFEGFYIPSYRFISGYSQWLPVLGILCGCSLKFIAVSYSLCYALGAVMLVLFTLHVLKKPAHAIALLLYFIAWEAQLFFFIVSELQMGVALLFVFDAVYTSTQPRAASYRWFALACVLILPTVVFAHPMAILAWGGWAAYRLVSGKLNKVKWLTAAGVTVVAYAVKHQFFIPEYERLRQPGLAILKGFNKEIYSSTIATASYQYLYKEAFVVPLLFLLSVILLIRAKKWLPLLCVIGFTGLYFTVMMLYLADWPYQFFNHHFEHYFRPLLFMMLLPLADLLPVEKAVKPLPLAGLGLIAIIAVAKISAVAIGHHTRVKWFEECLGIMERNGIKKAFLNRNWGPAGMYRHDFWNAPNESLLLSGIRGNDHARTLLMVWGQPGPDAPVADGNKFLSDGWFQDIDVIKPRYFLLDHKPYADLEKVIPADTLNLLKRY